jgi:hypothetical protein
MKSVSAALENFQGINKIRKTIPDIYILSSYQTEVKNYQRQKYSKLNNLKQK